MQPAISLTIVPRPADPVETCEDCDVILTLENTAVDPQEAFWLNVDWTDERFCTVCKERREGDGPPDSWISYDPPDESSYREQIRDAGRGHLLG